MRTCPSARRWLSLASLLLTLGSCARTHFESGGVRYAIDARACCSVPEGTDYEAEAASCEARGCTWQPARLCMGVSFPDAAAENEHRERTERCERSCACVCATDVEACANVP